MDSILAAIYARTYSPNQRFNYSIKEQVNSAWRLCKQRGWVVRYVFVDEGESGRTVERPKFQLMLKNAGAGNFNIVVFWKLDRFCRSLVDLVNIERMLRQERVSLCSVTEFIDTTTPIGRFNFRNIGSFSELERELIGERARMGLYALAKQQKWPNPHPPLGYDKNPEDELSVNPGEANLVESIFNAYCAQKSMPQVAFDLNTKGIKTKKGRRWNARAVRDILTNRIYIGEYNVADVKKHVEEYKVVDSALFQKAARMRKRYREDGAKRLPMPEDRRMAKIDKVFNAFFEFLHETDNEDSSHAEARAEAEGETLEKLRTKPY